MLTAMDLAKAQFVVLCPQRDADIEINMLGFCARRRSS
jgi:hypothetical protein